MLGGFWLSAIAPEYEPCGGVLVSVVVCTLIYRAALAYIRVRTKEGFPYFASPDDQHSFAQNTLSVVHAIVSFALAALT